MCRGRIVDMLDRRKRPQRRFMDEGKEDTQGVGVTEDAGIGGDGGR